MPGWSNKPFEFKEQGGALPAAVAKALNHGNAQKPMVIKAGGDLQLKKAGGNSYVIEGPRRRGGGGVSNILSVSELPAIPTSGWREVYHTVYKQKFFAAAGDTYWSPESDWTTCDGLPGS